jgi:hypothetical protein
MINEDEIEVSENSNAEAEGVENSQTETPAEETAQQTVSEETNDVVEKGQPRKAYSKEEQAAYSFRKQLGKQRAKYEDQYSQLQQQYNALLERLDRLENPDKYAPLNRGQFQDDDSYIDALVQQRFDNMWNQKLQEAQQKYSEQTKQDQEVQAYKTRQEDNVKKLFKTPEAEQQYRQAIGTALQNGLGELIDSDKDVAQYIMRSDLGPKILYEFATNPQEVEKMFNDGVTEMDRQFMIRDLENRLRSEITKPAMPVIGKPGVQAEAKPGSIFDSDDSILNYLRTH